MYEIWFKTIYVYYMLRKLQKKRKNLTFLKRTAIKNNVILYGKAGLSVKKSTYITDKQLETCRILINRFLKKEGKIWKRVYCYKSVTKKASEVRMGKGKGAIVGHCCPVKKGTIILEVGGDISIDLCRSALKLARHKLPVQCSIVVLVGEKTHDI